MQKYINLDRYPLHLEASTSVTQLMRECVDHLGQTGMFSLPGFLRQEAIDATVAALDPLWRDQAFTHAREHNIYFEDVPEHAPSNHPGNVRFSTVNHTLCADQLDATPLVEIYQWPPLISFLARTLKLTSLYPMADPLAKVNVMAYGNDEALNWHFDRSEFTTTLLLQKPEGGGVFEYRRNLRANTEPSFEAVSDLLGGRDKQVLNWDPDPGTLNVFLGRDTAHRVTPVVGARQRIIAVFSYYDVPGKVFSAEEQAGFYGRSYAGV